MHCNQKGVTIRYSRAHERSNLNKSRLQLTTPCWKFGDDIAVGNKILKGTPKRIPIFLFQKRSGKGFIDGSEIKTWKFAILNTEFESNEIHRKFDLNSNLQNLIRTNNLRSCCTQLRKQLVIDWGIYSEDLERMESKWKPEVVWGFTLAV